MCEKLLNIFLSVFQENEEQKRDLEVKDYTIKLLQSQLVIFINVHWTHAFIPCFPVFFDLLISRGEKGLMILLLQSVQNLGPL